MTDDPALAARREYGDPATGQSTREKEERQKEGKETMKNPLSIFDKLVAALEVIRAGNPVTLEDGREWAMTVADCKRIAAEALEDLQGITGTFPDRPPPPAL